MCSNSVLHRVMQVLVAGGSVLRSLTKTKACSPVNYIPCKPLLSGLFCVLKSD